MITQAEDLNILMNGLLVGTLTKTAQGGLRFTYAEQWLNTPNARPLSLSLPLTQPSHTGDIVYNFFDNLLPDNPQIRARIQAKFQASTSQPFDLLAKIGKDCIGAIQIISGAILQFIQKIKFVELTEKEIAAILRQYQNYPLGMTDQNEFRISLAGAQEKSAFLYYQNKWCRPLADTPTSHIFKLPIGFIQNQHIDLSDSCENEWLCTQIVKGFGLPVANCEILQFEEVKVLAVERFDRKLSKDKGWLMRLPQEDMCQALGVSPHLKYQADGGPGVTAIMNLLQGAKHPAQDSEIFFRTQVVFWLLAAIDGHAKNFSIFLEPEGKYRLTPLYDIMSAYPLLAQKQLQPQKIKMAMALKGETNHYHWYNVQRRHFLSAAKAAHYSLDNAEAILDDTLAKIPLVIEHVRAQLPADFPKTIAESIFKGMEAMRQRLRGT